MIGLYVLPYLLRGLRAVVLSHKGQSGSPARFFVPLCRDYGKALEKLWKALLRRYVGIQHISQVNDQPHSPMTEYAAVRALYIEEKVVLAADFPRQDWAFAECWSRPFVFPPS